MISGDDLGDDLFLVTISNTRQVVEMISRFRWMVDRHLFGSDPTKKLSNLMAVTMVTIFPPTGDVLIVPIGFRPTAETGADNA